MIGRIVKAISGFYYVQTPQGVYQCRARGIFRKDELKTPLVGDLCEMEVTHEPDKEGSVETIFPRTNEMIRPAIANVNLMAIVVAAGNPQPSALFIDKLVLQAEMNQITPFVIINKTDQEYDQAYVSALLDGYDKVGYRTFLLSAKTRQGMEGLFDFMRDSVTVFAGASGVGKSSLLNAIEPRMELLTGDISKKIGRGRHTTRRVELFDIGQNAFIADTPGFSNCNVDGIEKEQLQEYFIEFDKYREQCRFRGCNHINEPQCAVKQAVADGQIGSMRYDSYLQLFEEIQQIKKW